jgi:hypothetical protein
MQQVNEQTKEAYRQKVEAQLDELKAQRKLFEAKLAKSGADVRLEFEKRMVDWQRQFNTLEGKLSQLSNTAEDSWNEIQLGIDKSLADLRNAVENAAKKINQ